MSDLELTMMRRVGELNKENARLKEAIADSYKAVDEMEKRFKELEAEFEMHPMAVENARLKAEVERLTAFTTRTIIPNEELKAQVEELELEVFAFDRTIKQASCHYDNRLEDIRQLQAQVERLTKAGDELWEFAKLADTNAPKARRKALKDWNAAKEGKGQP
jgi:predicted nuclease with TOPRIM domain